MIFAACEHEPSSDAHKTLMARGFDVRFGYSSGYVPDYDYPPQDEVIEAQCGLLQKNLEIDNMHFIPTPTCFRDSTPRYSQRWLDLGYTYRKWNRIWYLSPEKYRELLERMKQMTDALPEGAWGRKMIMIDNWNEWDEGHFVAPSHKFGFRYLQAIREVFTARDNLPDYRSPQDQGFGGYNTSWRTPDFSEFCEKRLQESESYEIL